VRLEKVDSCLQCFEIYHPLALYFMFESLYIKAYTEIYLPQRKFYEYRTYYDGRGALERADA
jgi:hypothetical protein